MPWDDDEALLTDNMREKLRLLPAWFCRRMMARDGAYVLILNGGIPVGVRRIKGIHQDSHGVIWLDIELLKQADAEIQIGASGGVCAPIGAVGEKQMATLNSTTIMLAYEIDVDGKEKDKAQGGFDGSF